MDTFCQKYMINSTWCNLIFIFMEILFFFNVCFLQRYINLIKKTQQQYFCKKKSNSCFLYEKKVSKSVNNKRLEK